MIKEAREFNDVYNYMQYLNKHPEGGCASEFCDFICAYSGGYPFSISGDIRSVPS